MDKKKITIALAGNPNCGKTTIFNALTGANQHVGNYSGETVEKRDGEYRDGDTEIKVIDLPGTYSLHSHSPEERVAQDERLSGKIDLLVAIVDSGALDRSLIFVSQLMQLNMPMILCLNMWDEAEKAGLKLDLKAMQGLLGMPIFQTVGSHKRGIAELKAAILDKESWKTPAERLRLGDILTEALGHIKAALPAGTTHPDWVATRLLLDDHKFVEEIAKKEGDQAIRTATAERKHIEADSKMDISLYVTERYYGFIDGLLKEVTLNTERADARATSDRIDKVLVHPILGLPFFLIIVYILFQLTFTLGQYPMDWIETGFEALSEAIQTHWPDGTMDALKSLIVDGIIGGVGGVVVFLPNILILFLGLSFLEDCGYMARSAFLMDKLMHKVGLHGRSFIPLITGFGCSVPGLMATRTIAGEKERLTTMFVLPFMSCGARLPIWLLLVPCFFPPSLQAPAMMGIYLLGVLVALLCAFVLRKTVFKGQEEPFVMELPPYRMPTLHASLTHMWERAWLYLKKAGTVILAISIVLWVMTAYPKMDDETAQATQNEITAQLQTEHPDLYAQGSEELDSMVENAMIDQELQYSAIGRVGRFLEPVVKPMGFDWKITTALIGAFAAKEVFVSQMGIVYSLGEVDEENGDLRTAIRSDFDTLTGICLIIFLLLTAPCMATFAVMKRESNSWKYAFAQFLGFTLIAYTLATLVQQIGRLFI